MKIFARNFLSNLMVVGAGAMITSSGGGSQYGRVSISVYCKGVDWKGLTIEEDNFSAVALMESYKRSTKTLMVATSSSPR